MRKLTEEDKLEISKTKQDASKIFSIGSITYIIMIIFISAGYYFTEVWSISSLLQDILITILLPLGVFALISASMVFNAYIWVVIKNRNESLHPKDE